jgi:LysR family transcriptional regulator, transcriptional activator for dmlA
MLEHNELQVFASVAKHLSFAHAARDLGHSAPNVSKIVSQLEERLQKTLFLRTTRSVKLSEEGNLFLPVALRALDSLQEANDLFQKTRSQKLSGKIRITAPQTLASRLLSRKIAQFHRLHPDVDFEVLLSDSYLDLVTESIDVAFRVMRLHDSSIKAVKVAENPVIFCANPLYLKTAPKLKAPEDLKKHSVLAIASHLELKFEKNGKRLSQFARKPWLQASNGDLAVDQARWGCGILVRSRWGVQAELDRGELVEVKLNDRLFTDSAIYLAYADQRFMPHRTRVFIDFMKSAFQLK